MESRSRARAEVASIRVARSRFEGRYAGSPGPAYWSLAPGAGRRLLPAPDTVRYGTTPVGFTATPPRFLTPGRYELDITCGDGTHAVLQFRVATDGRIVAAGEAAA